ncbi:MAG TPA: tRNA (adenosine(37)-N6)-dimethylallyltransferase MiaA [Chitinophagales bacterium]|nr:tRNA (adenosine(37)-N6)-dimethylallyltransferase MiaA [Chitinophagales bacterium]HNL84494.1 tRNA (adenosine(37)-N6)-dimethylallyltransferase MiaA [Chitinophagales bacterium]
MHNNKHIIIIGGPTAVGKTALAIDLAKAYNTEIISADSRQIYKELAIGVARPAQEELALVPHHCIAHKSIRDYYSSGEFEKEALQILSEQFLQKDTVVVCGGSGFYIQALCDGMDEMPEVDEQIRTQLNHRFQAEGLQTLQTELKLLDEETFLSIDIFNTQRVIRALEVCLSTGKKFSSFKQKKKIQRPFGSIKIALNLPKEKLHERINKRVDWMMENDLLEEAKAVLPFANNNALRTVGYQELFDYFAGKTSLNEAVDLIKMHTRQFAKRQLTWFRRDKNFVWFAPDERDKMETYIQQQLNRQSSD